MSEDELDKIKKSFVRAKDGCSLEVACLLTVMKYYGGTEEVQKLTEWCTVDGKLSLGGMKQAAIRAGMQADLRLLDIELLARMKLPIILFAKNDFGRIGYAVCYGMHGERFIVWEPDFGPMQYWPKELNTLWIKGICMTLFPTPEFSEKADYHLKWWELYDWSKKCKRKLNRWWDYWSVEIFPLFRW
ncbi:MULTISPECIES: cysteine peptidase family C39 domain-containing protein [Bacteroides]|uniref:Cysteine peptidase family C39 domain-containing protein n=2 Tax=Bacteroides TaxID=816 RepID=A0A9X2ST37_9BACE|nr:MULTISPECIES: cysteine peptidase family C39 domain-containing protein [Bacteroides]MCR6505619.1 cysteine peptidase family C39 domain-containing protein [Bacteroides muris (ex Fokt et al. 2023)]MCR6509793.1 cysteine peptidase family C39 domain-containing protein [Bacteroides muris (ex Fokt et al. 2023)]NVK94359.1 peptidase C39 [Bacteroides sp. L10-4]TGX99576.1 peptidase C39 [Bacteroides muris (ex Afrizal et al. 2022)]